MGIVRTMGQFCYIECDEHNCSKKIEHIDENILKQLARICEWENKGPQWLCPDCAGKEPTTAKRDRKYTEPGERRSQIQS